MGDRENELNANFWLKVGIFLRGEYLAELAEQEGKSKSMAVRDLVKEAVKLREDVVLAAIAGKRAKNFDNDTALPPFLALLDLSMPRTYNKVIINKGVRQ